MASKQNWDQLNAAIASLAALQAQRQSGLSKSTRNTGAGASGSNLFSDLSQAQIPQLDTIPEEPGVISKIFDFISRPMHAVANLAKDTIDPDPNTDNPLESLWAGLSGVDKTSWRDVIQEHDDTTGSETPDWLKGLGGLVGDIALDPTMYIPLGWAGKLAGKGIQAVTKGKAVGAAEKELGHVVPDATSAADAIAAHTPPPPAQVQGAGQAFAARAGAAHQPPVTELGIPSIRPATREQQLAAFGEPSRTGATPSAPFESLESTLGAPRTQGESLPLFDEAGNQTYRTMGPTPDSALNIYGAGPKAPAPPFDLPKMGDDLRNLAATDPRQLRRVGLNGPTAAAHAGEQQLGLFGKGDLTSAAGKAAEDVAPDVAAAAPTGRGLFGMRELNEVSKIPTNWPQPIKDLIAEAAKKPLPKDALKLPSKATDKEILDATQKVQQHADTSIINDSVAQKLDDTPAVITPVEQKLTESQQNLRRNAWTVGREQHIPEEEVRQSMAREQAYRFGADENKAYKEMFGDKSLHTPSNGKVTSPNTTGSLEGDVLAADAKVPPGEVTNTTIREASNSTGVPLTQATAQVTGKLPEEILQNGRKITEPEAFTHEAQWRNVAKTTAQVHNDLTAAGLKGAELQAAKMTAVPAAIKAHEAENIAKGMYPEITSGNTTYRMSITDGWEAVGPKATRDMQFTPHSIPPSSQQTAMAHTIKLFQAGVTDDAKAIKEIASALSAKPGAHWTGQVIRPSGKRATDAAKAMWDAREQLTNKMLASEEAFRTRDAFIGKQAGEEVGNEVVRKLNDNSVAMGDKLESVANMNRDVTRTVRERGASPKGAAIGSEAAGRVTSPHITPLDVKNANHYHFNNHAQANTSTWNTGRARPGHGTGGGPTGATKTATQGTAQSVRQAGQANASANIHAIQAAGAAAGVPMSELAGWTSDGLFRKIVDGFGRLFSSGYGMGAVGTVGRQQFGHFGDLVAKYSDLVTQGQKLHTNEASRVAWEALRNHAGKAGLTPEQAAAYDALEEASLNVVSHSKGINSWGDSPMFRESLDPQTVNQVMHKYSIKDSFRAKDNHLEVPEQWREWQQDNPWVFLQNMHSANMELAARSGVGRYFTHELGSKVAQEGFVKIARSKEFADLSHVIDTDLYYPREAAEWLGKYSREVDKATQINNKLVSNWLDPYLSMWKTSTTIIRPGHHIRNVMGDTIMNMMDGIRNPLFYRKAFDVQRTAGGFKGFGGDFADIRELAGNVMPKPTGKALEVTLKGGKTESLAYNQIYWLAHRAGLLMDYRPAEDILEHAGEGLGKVANYIEKTRPVKFMGNVSEMSSTNSRLAHIIGLMSDKKVAGQYDNLESMFNGLTARVQKFHPDVKGLTKFEQKYMRRAIPFYNWFKQAMPTLMMTTLTHPARVTAIPKAQFNLQVALGGNPENYENPFDPTKLYPDFLRSSIAGPLGASPGGAGGGGFMYDLGSPLEAAGQMFNGNVGENLAGMLNPLVQTPWGLISGNHPLNSQHYIPDKGEWIDKSLPFLNQVANLTGFSPSGSVETLLSEGKIDPQRAMQKGEKDALANQNMINFMAGLNIQNTERPTYWNIARNENQATQESLDPNVRTKKRIEAGKQATIGANVPAVYTGRLAQ